MQKEILSDRSRPTSGRPLWRFCYWSGVIVLFAWAAWRRFGLPLDPIADHDVGGYLFPALTKLVGGAFGHTTYGWTFIYQGFLYLLLRAFGDFRAITVVQHILGLVAAGIFLLTWWRVRVFVANPRVGATLHSALGLLAAAVFLLASEPMHFEMRLRPEGICAFFVSINIYLVIQFIACCFIENRRTAAVLYGIAALLSSIALVDVRPSFALFAAVSLTPIGVFFFRRGWLRQKIALGIGGAMSALLLLLPEQFLSRHDEMSKSYLPTTLFVVHADLIRDQMADDLKRNAKVPYSREWLGRVHAMLGAEIAKSSVASHHRILRFHYDRLKHSIDPQLRREFGGDVSALCSFYRFYYSRIWRQRPLLVLRKIARQMVVFYAPICPAYSRERAWTLTNEYRLAVASLSAEVKQKVLRAYPPAVCFMDRTDRLARDAPIVQHPVLVRSALSILAGTYMALFLAALALSVVVFAEKRHRSRLGWLAALVLFVYSYNLASCFEVAVIHTLQDPRYATVQVFFTILVQFLALWFLIEFVLETRDRAKASKLDGRSVQRGVVSLPTSNKSFRPESFRG